LAIAVFVAALPCTAQEESKSEKALRLCREGEVLILAGKIDDALGKFEEALDKDIKCIQAHTRYQDILAAQGKRDKLLKDYREFVKIMPNSALFSFLYGRLHSDDLDIEQKYFKKAVELDAKFYEARHALGLSYLSGKQYKAALEQFRECEKIRPEDPFIKFRIADVFLKLGQYEKARECYRKVEKERPGEGVVQYALGRSYAYQGKHGEALKYYEKADKLGFIDKDFFIDWGQSCLGADKKKDVVGVYEKLFLTDATPQDFAQIEQEILTLYNPFSDLDQAQKTQLLKAIKLLEDEEPDPAQAAAALAELAKKAPKSEAVQHHLGRALIFSGKKDEAVVAFKKALELNPGYPDPIYSLALLDCAAGKLNSAKAKLMRTLSLDPFSPGANSYAALVMFELKNYKQALKYAKRTYQITGSIRDVSNILYLAELYLEDDALYLDEFKVGPWKVAVYKGMPQIDPKRAFAYRFLARKDGKVDRVITVNSRLVRDVDGPDPDVFAKYHFLEETLRTKRRIEEKRHETYGKTLPKLDDIIRRVKKILQESAPDTEKKENREEK
jgi:tetratricopeptide (TPR) repeat protein